MKALVSSEDRKIVLRGPYDLNYRRNAVEILEKSKRSAKHVAKELGINESTLRSWRDWVNHETKRVYETRNPKRWSRAKLEAEQEQLKQENEDLKRQRNILKKALSIISELPPGDVL